MIQEDCHNTGKVRLLTVVGARPQIIKAAAVSRTVKEVFPDRIEETILHTGQHYDAGMSQVFFDELGIPRAGFNLGVGAGTHGAQTAKMITGIEDVLHSRHFDGVILYGDTNSTLAGAVAASKTGVPVFHVEAGLRSFNMSMPEEVNRIVSDHLSSILFAPTETALANLAAEGLADSAAVFPDGKRRAVFNSGDVMYDNSLHFAPLADRKCDVIRRLGLEDGNFILATIHRSCNTDDPSRLNAILGALLDISETDGIKVVLPLHPRTEKMLGTGPLSSVMNAVGTSTRIACTPPATFFEIIELEKHAKIVMTDSGGVQKEAFFFGKPCVIFRPETEWVEIVAHHAGILADADRRRILDAYNTLKDTEVHFPELFGNGQAARFILDRIIEYLA